MGPETNVKVLGTRLVGGSVLCTQQENPKDYDEGYKSLVLVARDRHRSERFGQCAIATGAQ